jgi:hypothetical protein
MRVERLGGMRQTSWLDGLRIARVFGVRLGEVSQYRD